jgi:DNA polymerase (family 10)
LEKAEELAQQIKAAVEKLCDRIEIAGSIRRRKPKVHDIDFVAIAKTDADWQKISEALKKMKAKPNCTGKQLIKTYVPTQNSLFQTDFYRAKPSTFGIHLLIRTGSAQHNCWLAAYAISKGMRLKYSQGLIKGEKAIAGADESEVFAALGLPCPLPMEREIADNKPVWLK